MIKWVAALMVLYNHNANPKPRISIITITKQNQLAGSLWQQLHQRTSALTAITAIKDGVMARCS
jgi:hypothetical protein